MRRSNGAFWCVVLLAGLLGSHGETSAQTRVGSFEITGFYRYTVNASTGGANPNNPPVSLVAEPGKPDLLLMQQVLNLNIYGKVNDNWSILLEPRFTLDSTRSVDNSYRPYESLPSDFSGGDHLLRYGGKNSKIELSQAYVNYSSGNLWLRVGKQPIAWGEAIAQRVLDVVNPLDLSQFFFFDRAQEEFEGLRIPQWFIRAAYTMPIDEVPDFTLEFLVNPGLVTPTILPDEGAPYNVLPGILKPTDNVQQGKATVGMRATGTLGDAEFSLNFLTKPNDDGVGVVQGLVPAREEEGGVPILAGIGNFTPFRLDLQLQHPRVYIFGGSLNYFWQDLGALLRFETTVTPKAPFSETADSIGIIERTVWKSVIQIDRPTYVFPGLSSMSIGLGYFFTYTDGDLSQVYSSGAKVDPGVHTFSMVLVQPLFRKSFNLELLVLYDTDDSHWVQPAIHWNIGDHVRLDLLYNGFGGAEKRPGRVGSFSWADGVAFRFTYGF